MGLDVGPNNGNESFLNIISYLSSEMAEGKEPGSNILCLVMKYLILTPESLGHLGQWIGAFAQNGEIAAVAEYAASLATCDFLDDAETFEIGERCIHRRR